MPAPLPKKATKLCLKPQSIFAISDPVKVIGLTGGIASGKSTVAAILRKLGVPVIDADALSREVIQPGQEAWREILATFGHGIVEEDEKIDRKKLRKIIFDNPERRKELEAIVHPRVRALAEKRIRELGEVGHCAVVYEVPLLFESQLHLWLRPVILVACDVATQRQRLQARDHLTGPEAQRHLDAQLSLEEKRGLADYVIENDGTLEDLEQQIRAVLEKIWAT